jgi:hypothetical protein
MGKYDARAANPKEAKVQWMETLQTVVAALVMLGVAAASLFRYGSRIGTWFSELRSDQRTLYRAAIGLVCWTVTVAGVAWAVALLLYLAYLGPLPDTLGSWATASSIAFLLATPAVAALAGLPWLVLAGIVRVLRWSERRSGDGPQGE